VAQETATSSLNQKYSFA